MENIIFKDSVDGIEVERIERNSQFNMISKHFHNEFEIYYLLNGERYYFIEKQTYHIKEGSLVFIDRNQIHKTVGSDADYHERMLLLISEKDLEDIFNYINNQDVSSFFENNYGVIELNEDGQRYAEGLLFAITDELEQKHAGYEFLIRSKLTELMIFAYRCKHGENAELQVNTVRTVKYKKINEIADYISKNYQKSISLDTISKDFFISKCYLSRIFKEITGFTVNEYINIVRIKKARQHLENSEYSITEIAELIGYESITYFEKVFKKYMEVSPLRYRRKYSR
ncbi:MAG TPA: AraC family transcriptional regulator, partial [Mobilitalea sp.]|nr:AraC family transcriptional regulator [Mobilitalea sp.]